MGRSVSSPTNAQVICYQHHESYWYCYDCDERTDEGKCPNDTSDHSAEFGEEHDYCYNCEKEVESSHFDPHEVVQMNDWEWDDFLCWFREACQEHWPSLEKADEWIGREDHVLLENAHATIGVSGYCGLVACWIVPYDDEYYPEHQALHEHWISQIEPRFRKMFGRLRKLGHFSNGNAVFQRIEEV